MNSAVQRGAVTQLYQWAPTRLPITGHEAIPKLLFIGIPAETVLLGYSDSFTNLEQEYEECNGLHIT